jgi:two-component system, NarL family, nitrate/nitrite response regulator NarL
MGNLVTTLIVEPRSLVCQALVSLMESHSYHVVGGASSTADIGSELVAAAPKLVILGTLPMEEAAIAASCIRKLWPKTKIVHLFEGESSVDFQALLASAIDGCIPLSASPDTLIGTLQQIIAADFKMFVLRKALTGCEAAPRSIAALPFAQLPITPVVTSEEARKSVLDGTFSNRVRHGLSEREGQILKDLVKGLSNKIIARKLDIAEATVKVHMKSILRKIRVANRTQGAIWALENGYGADAPHPELPPLEAILQPLEAPQQQAY